jgi:hypothetical protein
MQGLAHCLPTRLDTKACHSIRGRLVPCLYPIPLVRLLRLVALVLITSRAIGR